MLFLQGLSEIQDFVASFLPGTQLLATVKKEIRVRKLGSESQSPNKTISCISCMHTAFFQKDYLMVAVIGGHAKTVKLLVREGAE